MPDDTPDLVRRLDADEDLRRVVFGCIDSATDKTVGCTRVIDTNDFFESLYECGYVIVEVEHIRAQAAEIAALQVRDVKIAQDLDEIFTATFGNVGSEPNVYADYDNCTQLQGKMRRAIQLLRPIAPAPDAEGG